MVLLRVVEMSLDAHNTTTTCGVRQQFPIQFIADYVNTVLDKEMGELLEYRHLIKHPKKKEDWGFSFGNGIGRLAQACPDALKARTQSFTRKSNIPKKNGRT